MTGRNSEQLQEKSILYTDTYFNILRNYIEHTCTAQRNVIF